MSDELFKLALLFLLLRLLLLIFDLLVFESAVITTAVEAKSSPVDEAVAEFLPLPPFFENEYVVAVI